MSTTHPLPVGSRILSVFNQCDALLDDEGGEYMGLLNHSGPMAVGEVVRADYYGGGESPQGWTYGVLFPGITPRPPGSHEPQPVFVFIDQRGGIDDPTRYRVLEG
jgi:hypothetical protein